jgi:hypothetical protein
MQNKQIRKAEQTRTEAGLTHPSDSIWAGQMIGVPKKDGDTRWCNDMRPANRESLPDRYLITRMSEIFDFLSSIPGAFIIELDATAGYHQVPIEEESKKFTAYLTPLGLREANFMCMGFRNSMQIFTRNMDLIFSGLQNIILACYVDNIYVVTPPNFETHLQALRTTFSRCRQFNLKLKASKSQFFCKEINALGHHFSPQGVRPLKQHLDIIGKALPPTSLKDLERFLGLANYYRRYIRNYAQTSSPLETLLGKPKDFYWNVEHQKA